MGFWRQPQQVWFRRALFQIHLWTGVLVGLYVIVISVSGSAAVFRRDLSQAKLANVPAADASVPKLTDDQLRQAILRQRPGATISRMAIPRRRLSAAEAVLVDAKGQTLEERYNPYTGAFMGPSRPVAITVMEWVVDLHDNLLAGETGRQVNAIGGGLLVVLCLTGIPIWWRGSRTWAKGLYVNPRSGWNRLNFDLHSALGFWSLAILLLWGVTGVYFAFPDPFVAVIDHFQPPAVTPEPRSGDEFMAWMVRMHFGRYGGLGVRITYVIIGLLPAVLFVTGAIMWWNRALRRWVADLRASRSARGSLPHPATE